MLLQGNVAYGCQSFSSTLATGQDVYEGRERGRTTTSRGRQDYKLTTGFSSGLPDDLNEDLRIQRLQDWLGFAQMNDRECDIESAHKATFKWALQPRKDPKNVTTPSPNLAKFLRDRDGLFWIQGKLGSGKSTLMKYMWRSPLLDDYLRSWAKGKPLYRAAFFFTKKGTSELQKSLQGLYRTLLAHLIRSDTALARIAFPHWRLLDASHEPTVAVLRNALLRILEHATLSRKYCFFIDGLDEYAEANPKLQTELARDILDLTNLPGVKIVAASRPEAPFAGRFHGCPTLHLQDLTQGDIEAYVTAELTRSAACTSRPLADDQIEHLVDQVVQKAEGVFLWVVLVVTDLVVGIDHAEPYHELDESLNRLDRDLHTLFKQILLERIPLSHRRQIVRHLLISSYNKEFEFSNHGTVHAVGIQVQAGSDHTQPDIYDRETSCQMTMDLTTQLPIRSRGLCSVTDSTLASEVSVSLIHSSMYEFLADPIIRTTLKGQAGSDFEPGLAVSIGLMAHLVVALHDNCKDRSGIANTMLDLLSDAVRSIEIDRSTSGSTPLRSMTCLQNLTSRRWQGYPFPTLSSLTWSRTLPATGSGRPALKLRAGFLEYATYKGYASYLQHQIALNNNTIPATDGCPLLFYAVSWNSLAARLSPSPSGDVKFATTSQTLHPQELLLHHNANPNELYEGRTPWGELLRLFRNYLRDDSSYDRTKFALDVLSAALDVARCMLLHGADPSLGEEQAVVNGAEADRNDDDEDTDVVSTRIFDDLLKETCCTSGGRFTHCSCADARLFRPQFVELAELVERKKLEKRLEFFMHLGWVGVQMARLNSVSYYVWAGLVALLVGLLLVLFV